MIRKYHLPHRFPPAVLAEAQDAEPIIPASRSAQAARLPRPAHCDHRRRNRARFRRRGHSSAIWRTATSNCRCTSPTWPTTSRPDSALDQEARLRGTSVYFPDRAVPMLPLELSTDICSLRPQVDRLVMSCVMEIDHHGEIVGYELSEGMIRSAERMTYTDVNAVLEGDAGARERYSPLVAGVRTDARPGADPESQARAPRLHRFRSARAGDRVRRIRTDEEHHPLRAQHRASPDRRVHAFGQRVRGARISRTSASLRSTAFTKSPTPSGFTTSK